MSRNRLARLNTDGSLDLTFDPGAGVTGNIYSVSLLPNGNTAIAGPMYNYNGVATPSQIAVVLPTGQLDPVFNLTSASLSGYYVNGIRAAADGSMYLANENNFYRFAADGTILASAACNGTTTRAQPLPNGNVIVTCNNYSGFKLYTSDLTLIGNYGTFATKNGWGRVYTVTPLND